jgi:hypothetical protein
VAGALSIVALAGLWIVLFQLVKAPGHALTQGFVWSTMLFYLFVDVMLGATAYLTGSILPGIAIHAAGLLSFFTLIWPYDATRRLVAEAFAHGWFWAHVGQATIFGGLAALAFKRLASVTPRRGP